MEALSPSALPVAPIQGDFARGSRTNHETLAVRGDFATGARGIPAPRHHVMGDFAVGLRSRLHDVLHVGDFATGLRTADAEARG